MKRRQNLQRESIANGGGRRGSLKKEEDPEVVENPTCPILKKIAHSFVYAKKAVFAVKDGDLAPGSRVLRGRHTLSDVVKHLRQCLSPRSALPRWHVQRAPGPC